MSQRSCPENTFLPSISTSKSIENEKPAASNMPLIPPKVGFKLSLLDAPTSAAEPEQNWMYVMSPREVHGAKGPHSAEEMRFLYRMGDILDSTMVWTEGQKKWEKIENLPKLRYQLMTLPEIPSKKTSELEISTVNPVLPIPNQDTALACTQLKAIDKFHVAQCCSRCGAVAFGHAQGHAEQFPDLNKYGAGKEINFNIKFVAEIVPGFLWIGNQAASRSNNLETMGITMSVGCTFDIKNPPDAPPKFRGHRAPLAETPIPLNDPRTCMLHAEPLSDGAPTVSCSLESILDTFEKAYDFIEHERLWRERAEESDIVEKKKLKGGSTDEFGRPVKSKYDLMDGMAAKRDFLFIKEMPCRVLVWCKNGVDRSCAVAVSYLIRKFGVTVQYAENLINTKRKGVSINPIYREALEAWSKKHTLGELLCDDCISGGLEPMSKYNVPTFEAIANSCTEYLRTNGANTVLGDVRNYLFVNQQLKHPTRYPGASTFYFQNVIIDLLIGGSNLQDSGLKLLIDALSTSNAAQYLERIDLRNNGIECSGCGYLVNYLLSDKSSGKAAVNSVLRSLDLSHNRIAEEGAKHIARLLQNCTMILVLDVTNNLLGDVGGAALMEPLVQPNDDIFEEDEDVTADLNAVSQTDAGCGSFFVNKASNKSLIDLKIGGNQLSRQAITTAAGVVRSNMTLSTLTLDYGKFSSSDLRFFMSNMRTFGRGLQRLSLNDIKLSVDTVKDLFNVFEGMCPLSHLYLIRCGITKAHLHHASSQLAKSRFLKHLCLSNNNLEDEGIELVADAIRMASESPMLSGFTSSVLRLNADEVDREIKRLKRLNLHSVDVSCTNMSGQGATSLVEALGHNKVLKVLDMSDNNLGAEVANQLGALLLRSKDLVTLRLNRCHLLTKGANCLLRIFADDMITVDNNRSDNKGLRTLELSGNEIKDSFSESLRHYLDRNNVIQFIDIGFNDLTDEGLRDVKEVLKVTGSSSTLKKYNELNINLIGNPCDPYFLDMPNHSRAKATMGYSTQYNRSLSHVPLSTRDQFVRRMDLQNKLSIGGAFPIKNYVA